jgi:ABC-type nitrate/sulfonate/bicarbonate transport system permease component
MTLDRLWPRLESWIPTLLIVVLLGTWEWLSRTGRISTMFFPPPSSIIINLYQLVITGKLYRHLNATLGRLVLGLLWGCTPGMLIGLSMGWLPRLRTAIDPIVAALHPLPKIAIFPLILIIFGIGESSKVVAIAISAFFPMVINSMAGVRQINPIYFEVTKNFEANPWKIFTRVILPGSLPAVITGMRISTNTGLVITIAVELIASQKGLGVLTWFAWQTLRIQDLYASLVVLGFLGIIINISLQKLAEYISPWYHTQSNGKF